ncbi:MAG: hypothetical protein ACE14P_07615 [Methanotrichaceae archaeon]
MSSGGYLDRHFIRDIQGENLLELFLVMAVASILGIRFFLAMTGYPQVGGHGLHIAHVLVGGIFMLICIVILLSFLNRSVRNIAAILGGFGFGAFIDELGKFVTSDNNYFFQPTVGLIYITFILLYALIKKINSRRWLTEEERLINVLEISKEAVLKNMDEREKQISMDLIAESDQLNPVVKSLKDLLGIIELVPEENPGIYSRTKEQVRRFYQRVVKKGWFTKVLVGFFLIQAVISLLVSLDFTIGIYNGIFWTIIATLLLGIYRSFRSRRSKLVRIFYIFATLMLVTVLVYSFEGLELPALPITDWMQIGFTVLAGMFAVAGIYRIRKNRLNAYSYFKNSVLVYIFFVQVFTFFDYQFYGLLGLGVNILTLGVMRYMIGQESQENEEKYKKISSSTSPSP